MGHGTSNDTRLLFSSIIILGIAVLFPGAVLLTVLNLRSRAVPTSVNARTPDVAPRPATSATPKPNSEKPVKATVSRHPLGHNFALAANGGKVTGGLRPELLNDGDSTNYDGANGFGYTVWRNQPAESFIIELKETVEIDCVRFLLWDVEENRFYRYKLEVADSLPAKRWTLIADKTGPNDECKSWQVLRFEKRPVKQLRLTGTYNSANSGFHVVEFQACLAAPNGFPREPVPPVKKPDVQRDDVF